MRGTATPACPTTGLPIRPHRAIGRRTWKPRLPPRPFLHPSVPPCPRKREGQTGAANTAAGTHTRPGAPAWVRSACHTCVRCHLPPPPGWEAGHSHGPAPARPSPLSAPSARAACRGWTHCCTRPGRMGGTDGRTDRWRGPGKPPQDSCARALELVLKAAGQRSWPSRLMGCSHAQVP